MAAPVSKHISAAPSSSTGPHSSARALVARPGHWQQQRRQQVPRTSSGRQWRRSMAARAERVAEAEAGIVWQPAPELLQTLRTADAFCFDVDSTFCQDESIDELAAFLGVGELVAQLTAQAMGGTVLFQDSLATRLNAMRPSAADLEHFLDAHPPPLSPGIPELVKYLQDSGRSVFLVSGGFRQIIHPIAEQLGIPLTRVFANLIQFQEDGSYAGFDSHEFTSRSGGKREALQYVKQRDSLRSIVMVGDGATDAEARAPGAADAFVCYCGVVLREGAARRADWCIKDIHTLLAVLRGGEP